MMFLKEGAYILQEKKKLFALDIGTRSVVGIILEEHNGQYHVIDILAKEHTKRSMLDGQIHDVLSVSNIITEIKEQLEKRHGSLKKVSVAAAGRALKTEHAKATVSIKGKPMLQKQDILHLELSAVQQAQASVAEKNNTEKSKYYYCVGYSVLYYRLDGEEIGNLIDQQGEEASVEIIATFLPKVVVESLISALHRSGLEMEALTLEPIAAINVLIPPSMRRLNVALVDIGAGTSDIAITDMGTIIAYGMVPIAGDEITEAISDQYLLDFPLAEKAKRELHTNDQITITDILGFETEVSREEVINQISPAINKLAESICEEILQLNNGKPPKAVMLVGGGSLTPELPKKLAEKLNLPENRVAIRGIDAISSLSISEEIQKGPELVTPIGIAIAAKRSPVQYITVYVNEQPVRLFEVKKLTVGDCLLAAGINMNKLYGKPGMAMIVMLNGQNITIPGQLGEAPIMLLNGKPCSFDDEIQNGDQLIVEKGKDGSAADVKIADLLDHIPNKKVTINGKPYEVFATLTCNGVKTTPDKKVEDRDQIVCTIPETIEELLKDLELHDLLLQLRPLRLKINNRETFLPNLAGKVYRNGIAVKPQSTFDDLDDIRIEQKTMPTVKQLAEMKHFQLKHMIPVTYNGEKIFLSKTVTDFYRNGEILTEDSVLFDGDELTVEQKKMEPFLFQDLFKHVEITMPKHSGGKFVLLKNNKPTTFYDQIHPGDELKIVWPLAQEKNIPPDKKE
jgi:cell division protein FtsA